ncbi:uncharacterized protein EV422DRAFT_275018 [Fimicolochytrium jonesii]|uniref:uncharacterized protein n=1 Tax=Fimicolochytrium jonesii TaxID=1396493 RepID=UPI0022FF444C|nr:uncharacterized protein EV422DRAFT_275018 [Fimicolochytrium jonesii]KAI8816683.1 hypothetical protein EV422DRAFT_275018 [Fimicolochytrium jonesii]
MSDFFNHRATGPSQDYVAPKWPSLSGFVIGGNSDTSTDNVLWYKDEIIIYTILWTVILFSFMYGLAGLWAYIVFLRSKFGMVLLLGFAGIGLFAGASSGAVVGVLLASVYNAGLFAMATWIPLAWALVQIIVVLISSDADITLNNL